jgi:arginyl-tRNA synthetase
MERFARALASALTLTLQTRTPALPAVTPADLVTPPDPTLGDFAFACFKIAKDWGAPPPAIAQELCTLLKSQNLDGITVSASGAYVNFQIPAQKVFSQVLKDLLAPTPYGALPENARGTWILEYSSPNIAKHFMAYHLRPTALGAALARIGTYRGYHCVSINHLGDWGTQYGYLSVAFDRFGSTLPANPTLFDLVDIYVKANQAAESDPTIATQAQEAFRKLEQGDPKLKALWQKCVDISMKEFHRIYGELGIRFDHFWGESHYKDLLQPMLEEFRKKGLLVESEGAWVVPVTDPKGRELPPCILQKSDGATIYATRDVAAARYRYEKFKFDRMTYIVGSEQKLHFQQVFAVLAKSGATWASKCEHVPTGLYRFKDAKMSTRKGNFVTLDDILNLARERVRLVMKERESSFTPPELEQAVEAIAIGAVVFHDLSTDPARDVVFDPEAVVNFDGETGPYLQYAHTRCLSLLRKAGSPSYSLERANLLKEPTEVALVKLLGQFPMHLERALEHSKASQLTNYLLDVTKAFNQFYRECRVISEDRSLTEARMLLVEASRRILGQGMQLLGVPTPERM